MYQHHISKIEDANSKTLALEHCSSKVFIDVSKILKTLRENSWILQNFSMHQNGVT